MPDLLTLLDPSFTISKPAAIAVSGEIKTEFWSN
jgi:hypothetical protein